MSILSPSPLSKRTHAPLLLTALSFGAKNPCLKWGKGCSMTDQKHWGGRTKWFLAGGKNACRDCGGDFWPRGKRREVYMGRGNCLVCGGNCGRRRKKLHWPSILRKGVKQGLGEGFGDSLQRRDVLRRGIHQNMNGLRNNAGINRSIHVFVYLFL